MEEFSFFHEGEMEVGFVGEGDDGKWIVVGVFVWNVVVEMVCWDGGI